MPHLAARLQLRACSPGLLLACRPGEGIALSGLAQNTRSKSHRHWSRGFVGVLTCGSFPRADTDGHPHRPRMRLRELVASKVGAGSTPTTETAVSIMRRRCSPDDQSSRVPLYLAICVFSRPRYPRHDRGHFVQPGVDTPDRS